MLINTPWRYSKLQQLISVLTNITFLKVNTPFIIKHSHNIRPEFSSISEQTHTTKRNRSLLWALLFCYWPTYIMQRKDNKKLTKQIQFFTMDEQFCDLFLVGHYSPYITSDSEWIHHIAVMNPLLHKTQRKPTFIFLMVLLA